MIDSFPLTTSYGVPLLLLRQSKFQSSQLSKFLLQFLDLLDKLLPLSASSTLASNTLALSLHPDCPILQSCSDLKFKFNLQFNLHLGLYVRSISVDRYFNDRIKDLLQLVIGEIETEQLVHDASLFWFWIQLQVFWLLLFWLDVENMVEPARSADDARDFNLFGVWETFRAKACLYYLIREVLIPTCHWSPWRIRTNSFPFCSHWWTLLLRWFPRSRHLEEPACLDQVGAILCLLHLQRLLALSLLRTPANLEILANKIVRNVGIHAWRSAHGALLVGQPSAVLLLQNWGFELWHPYSSSFFLFFWLLFADHKLRQS